MMYIALLLKSVILKFLLFYAYLLLFVHLTRSNK